MSSLAVADEERAGCLVVIASLEGAHLGEPQAESDHERHDRLGSPVGQDSAEPVDISAGESARDSARDAWSA